MPLGVLPFECRLVRNAGVRALLRGVEQRFERALTRGRELGKLCGGIDMRRITTTTSKTDFGDR